MLLFLFLLGVCAVGAFLVMSLIWILFWAIGIFEVPQSVRNLFGAYKRPAVCTILPEFGQQLGTVVIVNFEKTDDPDFIGWYETGNSTPVSGYVPLDISEQESMAHSHVAAPD